MRLGISPFHRAVFRADRNKTRNELLQKGNKIMRTLVGVLLGVGVGIAIGVGTGNLGAGIGVGAGLAIVFGGGAALASKRTSG